MTKEIPNMPNRSSLPLTKALTDANRATFELSSEPRKGTLAEITFPTNRVLAD